MKKFLSIIIIMGFIFIITILGISFFIFQHPLYLFKPGIEVERILSGKDKNNNGIDDTEDILIGARKEIENRTYYRSAYYDGGYPPENEGVCTDVIWRALKVAGYDLKMLMDNDIRENTKDYPALANKPDPNIDFRRVKNQQVFFAKYSKGLSDKVVAFDRSNLVEWQPGDIIILRDSEHVAIVSDKRRKDGVPYIIHNSGPYPKEEDCLMWWFKKGRIVGHYRFYY